jgi:hypothetical protein
MSALELTNSSNHREYAIPYSEAARRLGYRSTKSVQRLVAAGRLRTIGRRVVVASLEAYVRGDQNGEAA